MSSLYNRVCHDTTYTYEHIKAAEQKLGRKLKAGEVVHHIDENKKNNDPSNLMVFSSTAEHTSYHQSGKRGGYLVKNNDGSYCYLADPPQTHCVRCGTIFYKNQISYNRQYCSNECRNAALGKGKCPSYENLKELCQTMNNCQIARMFGVSDKAVFKWKKKHNL